MRRYAIISLVAACSVMMFLSACHNNDGQETIGSLDVSTSAESTESSSEESKEMESDSMGESSELETEGVTVEETVREPSEILPDVAIYDRTVLEDYTLNINSAERYTVNYPEGYSAHTEDKYKSFFVKENTQIFLYCINDTFDTSEEIFYSYQVDDELYRFPYEIDGKKYTASVMDRGKKEIVEINGKSVVKESPNIEFASEDIKSFVKPNCLSYFTVFDGRGFAFVAVSTDKTIEELEKILNDMVSTLNTYTPSKQEADYEFGDNLFVANDSTGISFPYPEGWSVGKSFGGLTVISAPNDGSLYDGAKIIYFSDPGNQYVENYAQFAGVPQLIAPVYMLSGYDPEKLNTDFLVMSMDDSVTVDGIKCYLFEIEDSLLPVNRANELLLPSVGNKIYSYRYTFDSNGIPVMVSFHYTENNKYQVRDMADIIMDRITVK